MRNLPADMEQRILDAIQTIDNSADPKMKAFIQRVYRYIQPGAMLTPITIRTGDALGPLDVAVKREDPDGPAHELMMVYIEGGIAKLANSTSYVIQPTGEHWSYIGDIGQAIDVAIDYDGYWLRTAFDPMEYGTYGRFNLISAGEPWIFRVSPEGALIARQGILGSDVTLVESGVTKVDALRGWKSIRKADDDQGLIVAYIKDGDVYYRTYAEQVGGTYAWESERQITEFDTSTYDAVNIAMFRTTDYRSGILAEINGIIYMLITHRNWSGMALPDEIIVASITDYELEMIAPEGGFRAEILECAITDYELAILWGMAIELEAAENIEDGGDWGSKIVITFDRPVDDRAGNQTAFTVTDGDAVNFIVSSTAAGPTGYDVLLIVQDFNGAVGDLTIKYDGAGSLVGGEGTGGQAVGVTDITFTPVNLVPPVMDPPEVEAMWNE